MMARIIDNDHEDLLNDGTTASWSERLTVEHKQIWWKELYELDVSTRVFQKKKEPKQLEEPSNVEAASNQGLETILKRLEVMDERFKKLEQRLETKLNGMENQTAEVTESQRVLRKRYKKMARRVTTVEELNRGGMDVFMDNYEPNRSPDFGFSANPGDENTGEEGEENKTEPVAVEDAEPVVEEVELAVEEAEPAAVEEAEPAAVEEAEPAAVEEGEPAMEEAEPAMEEVEPAMEEAEPAAVEEVEPVVEDNPLAMVLYSGVEEVEPVVEDNPLAMVLYTGVEADLHQCGGRAFTCGACTCGATNPLQGYS